MVDFRAETASSSDKTEFTETEDQSRTHHLGWKNSCDFFLTEYGNKIIFGGKTASQEFVYSSFFLTLTKRAAAFQSW